MLRYDVTTTILGDAHRYYGSGMIGNVYELFDGTEIIVCFSNDTSTKLERFQ